MSFFRSVATVGVFTLLSRLLGFARDLLIATLLGAGPLADAFVVAQRLPNAFRSIFAEGAMDTAFVPIYTRKKQSELPESVQDFGNHVYTILLILLLPLTGLAIILMPHIIGLLAPGFLEDSRRFVLATAYSKITFGYLVLISLTALQAGLLNANGFFGPGAASPAILNATMIIGLGLAAYMKWDPALVGSWTLIIGGCIQLISLFIACRMRHIGLRFARPRLTVDVKQFFKLVGPGALGTAADQLNALVLTVLASSLPAGVISGLYYADRLNQLPLGVIGGAVATALLPALTTHINAKDDAAAIHYFSRAVEIALMLAVPVMLVLVVAPHPVVRVLFEHGVFDAGNARVTAEIMQGYALMIPAAILCRLFTVRFFATENTRQPVIASLISIVLNAGLGLAFRPLWAHFGITLAYSITTWIDAVMLFVMLRRMGYGTMESGAWTRLPRVILANAALVGVLIMDKHICVETASRYFEAGGTLHAAVAFAMRVTLAGLAYVAALTVLGVIKAADVKELLRNAR